MNKIFYTLFFTFHLLVNIFCQKSQENFVHFLDPRILYEGRTGKDGSSAILYWSGTQIEVNFRGTGINAIFLDNTGNNYYNLILDNDSLIIFRPEADKKMYSLLSGLPDSMHNLKIYKRTEWNRGTTYFYGFILDKGVEILDPPQKKIRKFEFYGNSITAGFGVEDYSGNDRSDSIFTNNYLTYAALTARHFNAQSHYIVRSGIGIMVSWFPLIMPELFDRLNPNEPESKWDFNRYQPDLVVINMLQNDAYLLKTPKSKEFQYRFPDANKPDDGFIIDSYQAFVKEIRNKYPKAKIICMLGNLSITKNGSPWPEYVLQAIKQLNDNMIYSLFIPYKNTSGHPRIEEQKKMADTLIHFIEKNIKW
jgi:hypothetical protein